jgi:hypothetical protein
MTDVTGEVSNLDRLTIINLCSSGIKLLSWKVTNTGAKDEKVAHIVVRLQAVAVAKQLPNAVIQLIEYQGLNLLGG